MFQVYSVNFTQPAWSTVIIDDETVPLKWPSIDASVVASILIGRLR